MEAGTLGRHLDGVIVLDGARCKRDMPRGGAIHRSAQVAAQRLVLGAGLGGNAREVPARERKVVNMQKEKEKRNRKR